ncbi:MAG: PAS domain-containing protein [Marinilabiliaceae bacterium]|nr:PAS domain-containing protein [Marinilabiliaceae bacterium]
METTNERILQLEEEVRLLKDELEENKVRLSMIMKAGSSGLWNVQVDHTSTDQPVYNYDRSKDLLRIIGVSDNALPKEKSWENLIHPEDRNKVLDAYTDFLLDVSGDAVFDVNYRLLKENGEYAHIQDFGTGIRDDNGNLLNIIGGIRDITELKIAEEELINEKQRLQTLSDNIPNGVLFRLALDPVSEKLQMIYVSAQWELVMGFPAESVLSDINNLFSFFPNNDSQKVREDLRKSAQTLAVFNSEHRILVNGDIRWVHVQATPRLDKTMIIWEGVVINITARKEAEITLIAEKERLEAFPDIVIYRNELDTKTNKLNYTFLSSGWEEMMGVSVEETMKNFDSVLAVIHPDDKKLVNMKREQARLTKTDFYVEFRIIYRGTIRWIRMSSRPHFENDLVIWDGYAINIDQRKVVEQELEVERNRLHMLANNLPDCRLCQFTMNTITKETTMSYISSDKLENEGIPFESAMNNFNSFLSFVHPDEQKDLLMNIQKSAARMEDLNTEIRFGGNWMQLSMRPHKEENLVVWDGFIMNINIRKTSEAELKKYRDKLETLVQERTEELKTANSKLNEALDLSVTSNRELFKTNKELEKTVEVRTLFFKILQTAQFSNDISADMKSILTKIGKFAGMSRIAIFENNNTQEHFIKTHEWHSDDFTKDLRKTSQLCLDIIEKLGTDYDGLIDAIYMLNQDGYLYISDNSENKNETSVLELSGNRSILIIPLVVSDFHLGYIEFDESLTGKKMKKNEIDVLVNMTRILSNATYRNKIETAMISSQQTMTAVLDNLDFVVYAIDIENYKILFANRNAKEVYGDIEGKLCWQTIQKGKTGPCDFCPNVDLLDENDCPREFNTREEYEEDTNKWLLRKVGAIKWTDGRWVQLNYATDITSLKNNELELNQVKQEILLERNRLMTIADNIPDNCLLRIQIKTEVLSQPTAAMDWISHVRLVYASSNWEAITNIPMEAAMENFQLVFQNFHHEEVNMLGMDIFNHLCSNTVLDKEIRFLFCDQKVKWLRMKFSSHIEDEWTVSDGIIFDKTDRKLEEIELKNYRENLEQLVKERTITLNVTNSKLEATNDELYATNEELYATIDELNNKNDQLATEVAARIEAVAKKEESEEKLSTFIKQTVEGIAFSDHEGKIIEWNPEQENITGITRSHALGRYGWEVFKILNKSDNKAEERFKILLNSLVEPADEKEKIKDQYEFEFTIDVGRKKYLVCSLFRITTGDNKYSVGQILRDVTEQKKAEKELEKYHTQLEQMVEIKTRELTHAKNKAEEADKLKSSFLANMSHEIRTPLNGIVGFLNFICCDDISDHERKEYIDIVNSNSIQLTKLIEDIIDISKIEANSLTIFPTPLKLNVLMHELKTFFEAYPEPSKKENIKLIFDNTEAIDDFILFVDNTRLRQTLTNLIVNAYKFTEKGYIKFGYRQASATMLEFVVEDTGIGISPEHQKVVFELFRQVDLGNTRQYGGTGLGLTISRNLVQLMGGEMWLNSETGKGTSFFFTIPFLPLKTEELPIFEIRHDKQSKPEPTDEQITVLIVEPLFTKFKYYEKKLIATGATVLHAENLLLMSDCIENNQNIEALLIEKENYDEMYFSNFKYTDHLQIVVIDRETGKQIVYPDGDELLIRI